MQYGLHGMLTVHRVACGATEQFIALVVFPLFLCKNK